ncbi:sulfatase-like hydrolase/transferase [Halobacteria archaeon HArc-gm2]|nr:sulfatase-like hydrolase/transferase [Halobacteria archaeon HArc-gm2]
MENVLFVTIDSLRADHVGYHGYERNTTPFINEYASRGSRFTNAFAHAGGTRFSFPALLTGVTPMMYGGYDRVSKDQTLVSEVFGNAGYRTGGFHSNLYISAQFGYDRGWNEFFDSAPEESTTAGLRKWAKTTFSGPILDALRWGYDFLESSAGVNVGSYHVPGDEITDKAIEFIETDDDRPTFLWVHYMDVHHPFLPPEEYQLEFRDEPVSDRESIKLRRKFIEEPEKVTDEEFQTFIDLYDAEILFNDAQIGRLMETVEDEWGDDYVMALTSDHGDHFLEHGYFGGARGKDVKTHVPLFFEGWDDDGTYDELVALNDIPTTLVDAVGLDVPNNFHGHSLYDLVFDGEWDRDAIYGGWSPDDGDHYVVREDRWKLIEHPVDEDELYDLIDDPTETSNRVGEAATEERRLREKLDRHRQRVLSTDDADVKRPDMSEDVKERLRRLGYKE